MNGKLLRALVALMPASAVFFYAFVSFSRSRRMASALRLLGAAGLVIVVLAHICEAFNVFPFMGWGLEYSVGHYLDLTSAVLGVTLFALGSLLDGVLTRQRNIDRVKSRFS